MGRNIYLGESFSDKNGVPYFAGTDNTILELYFFLETHVMSGILLAATITTYLYLVPSCRHAETHALLHPPCAVSAHVTPSILEVPACRQSKVFFSSVEK
jgi:hypothetical protein